MTDEKNITKSEKQAIQLYESLNIKQDSFVDAMKVGILHEKQMQTIYKDFSGTCNMLIK